MSKHIDSQVRWVPRVAYLVYTLPSTITWSVMYCISLLCSGCASNLEPPAGTMPGSIRLLVRHHRYQQPMSHNVFVNPSHQWTYLLTYFVDKRSAASNVTQQSCNWVMNSCRIWQLGSRHLDTCSLVEQLSIIAPAHQSVSRTSALLAWLTNESISQFCSRVTQNCSLC